MSATIRQIAERAGLSVQTVSRVLNGQGHLHRPETVRKVLRAADRLGYRPNTSARAMRTGRFGCAALVGSAERRSYLPQLLIEGVHAGLAERDMHLSFALLPEEELTSDSALPKFLREWMVDGLLVNYHFGMPEATIDLIREHRIPSIWMNARVPTDAIRPDDLGAGQRATEGLLARGHERIAYADFSHPATGDPEHYSARDREEGYRLAMGEAGRGAVRLGDAGIPGRARLELAREALASAGRPTAIVTYSPDSAEPFFAAAMALGLEVPGDLAFVCVADAPASLAGVAIDTMVLPWREIGRGAVGMLVEKIEKPGRVLPAQEVECAFEAAGDGTPAWKVK